MKDKLKYIDVLLILALLIVVVSLYNLETFTDASNNKVPSWKPPKPDETEFMYTVLFITLIIIAIVSLSLFVYSSIKNEPSFLYATIGLSSIIIFMLVYLSKYE